MAKKKTAVKFDLTTLPGKLRQRLADLRNDLGRFVESYRGTSGLAIQYGQSMRSLHATTRKVKGFGSWSRHGLFQYLAPALPDAKRENLKALHESPVYNALSYAWRVSNPSKPKTATGLTMYALLQSILFTLFVHEDVEPLVGAFVKRGLTKKRATSLCKIIGSKKGVRIPFLESMFLRAPSAKIGHIGVSLRPPKPEAKAKTA